MNRTIDIISNVAGELPRKITITEGDHVRITINGFMIRGTVSRICLNGKVSIRPKYDNHRHFFTPDADGKLYIPINDIIPSLSDRLESFANENPPVT